MDSTGRAELHDLRRARKLNRGDGHDWVEAGYEIEMRVIFVLVLIIAVPALVSGDPLGVPDLARFRADAPGVLSITLALATWIALGAGARGAPLAPESSDVQWALLAPVARAAVLRPLAWTQVRASALAGAAIGAALGSTAANRIPAGETAAWVFAGALAGVCVALALWGVIAITSALGLHRGVAHAIGVVLVAWAAIDAALGWWTAPTTWVGGLSLMPLANLVPVATIGAAVVVAIAIPTIAIVRVGGNSLPTLARRSTLVSTIHFAASISDVRSVVLFHRQLAAELPRRRPWLSLRVPRRVRRPVWRRGWHGYLRWPAHRAARVVVLTGAAAALAVLAESTPLVLAVAGVAAFVAALDVIEPFAEEVDRPTLHRLYALRTTSLLARNLVAPVVALLAVAFAVFGVACALGAFPLLAVCVTVSASLAAVAAAACNVALGPPTVDQQISYLLYPETYGPLLLLRQALPPALAIAGLAPVVLRARLDPRVALGQSLLVSAVVVAVSLCVLAFSAKRVAND